MKDFSKLIWQSYSQYIRRFDKRPMLKHFLKVLPVIVGLSLGTGFAHHEGWLQWLENRQLDIYASTTPLKPKFTQIVEITDEDYVQFFSSRSPLKFEEISNILQKIDSGNPRAIVVDLDTSDPYFSSFAPPSLRAPVVWARTAKQEEVLIAGGRGYPVRVNLPPVFQIDPLLGKSDCPEGVEWGLSLFPQSSDGIIRYFCRSLLARRDVKVESCNTLAWQTLELLNSVADVEAKPSVKLLLPLVRERQDLPAISVDQLYRLADGEGWKELLRNKIVLLGGAYRAARDVYVTPVGEMFGVELVAQTLEGELQHKIPREADSWMLSTVGIFCGLMLAFFNYKFQNSFSVFAGFLVIPFLGFIVSLVLVHRLALWCDFVPVLVAVQFQALFDYIREHESMKRELAKREGGTESGVNS